MLASKSVDRIIFLDIEATSQYPTFKEMPEDLQKLFKKQFRNDFAKQALASTPETSDLIAEEIYSAKAPLHAPWAQIVCITVGSFIEKNITEEYKGDLTLKLKSFYGTDEKKLLNEFHKGLPVLDAAFNPQWHLAGHALKIYDVPMIAKRFILNRMPLPVLLDYGHKKPWEVDFLIDTLEVFKYGQFDGVAGLDLLAYCFGIESSKNDIDGSQVKHVYHVEKDINRIEKYCREDVRVTAEVYLRMKNMSNKVTVAV